MKCSTNIKKCTRFSSCTGRAKEILQFVKNVFREKAMQFLAG